MNLLSSYQENPTQSPSRQQWNMPFSRTLSDTDAMGGMTRQPKILVSVLRVNHLMQSYSPDPASVISPTDAPH